MTFLRTVKERDQVSINRLANKPRAS